MKYAILRVDADTVAPEDVAAIDRLLAADRKALVRAGEHLDGAAERLSEAAADLDRLFLVARSAPDGEVIGLADAQLHHPGPGALTIAAIAVDRRYRRLGVARALLAAAVAAGEVRSGGNLAVIAGVHDDNAVARAFFEAHGLVASRSGAGVLELVRGA